MGDKLCVWYNNIFANVFFDLPYGLRKSVVPPNYRSFYAIFIYCNLLGGLVCRINMDSNAYNSYAKNNKNSLYTKSCFTVGFNSDINRYCNNNDYSVYTAQQHIEFSCSTVYLLRLACSYSCLLYAFSYTYEKYI